MSLTRREFLKLSGAVVVSLPFSGYAEYAAADAVNIPVLMYHDISYQLREEETISPPLFAAQMEWLYDAGYRAVSFEEVDSLKAEDMRRAVIITFDDGYASFSDFAYPLFTEYGFKSTINIIGRHAGGFISGNDPRLSWDECRSLAASRMVEIGCHTYDLHAWHGNLSRADAIAAFNERLPQDLSSFQKVYTSELGRPAKILAWPYGRYDNNSIKIAKRAGFDYILSSNHHYFEQSDGRLDIPRFTIDNDAPLPLFRKIVERRS
jgi:peptidoglycan/xylan/chitin deacetylase (PgdA/CDA1 family)